MISSIFWEINLLKKTSANKIFSSAKVFYPLHFYPLAQASFWDVPDFFLWDSPFLCLWKDPQGTFSKRSGTQSGLSPKKGGPPPGLGNPRIWACLARWRYPNSQGFLGKICIWNPNNAVLAVFGTVLLSQILAKPSDFEEKCLCFHRFENPNR